MSELITIRKAPGKWVVFANGAVYGETNNALELSEGNMTPVIYVPREDIAMAFFDKTEKTTSCPHKGTASYYSIETKSTVLENVAWSYESPNADVAQIAGYLAFAGGPVNVEQQ
ncbi:DUF427 domain-containing protein [Rhodobacteraceae bacterium SC52]|nr:DUF427 domain-containing protein [Rhodobacteraceae bacterium SC52]